MNSTPEIHEEEAADEEIKSPDKVVARERCRPSLIVPAVQIALAAILACVVAHGLWRGGRRAFGVSTFSINAGQSGESGNGPELVTTNRNLGRAQLKVVAPVAVTPAADGLGSIHDIRDFLELHRVRRETRAYELGTASRDALFRMTLDSNRGR